MSESDHLKRTRIGCSLGVLGFCILIAAVIIKLKPETVTRPPEETVLVADVITATPENRQVTIRTHGVARPVRVVSLASEVAGRVIELPSRVEVGDRVIKGEVLLKTDPADYAAAEKEAEAALARLQATLKRLDTTETTTRSQLKVSRRSRDLAQADVNRLTLLQREGNAVSQATVEAAERTLAQAESQVLQLEQTLELIPSQRTEAESERDAAAARLNQARTQLDRTVITAPFTGRIVASMVEENSYLAPGTPVLEIADDRELEIQAPVMASELRQWLPFAPENPGGTWFPPLEPVDVQIEWTGSDQGYRWTGTLDRVVSFDATTRTAMIAIRISGNRLRSEEDTFPLTDGMFCRVSIPGKTLQQVIALPREAVSFDNKAYLSDNGRLRTVDVEVAWSTKEHVYISAGIQEGDRVVGTRLVAPLEGVKIEDTAD
jgi:RND family efflux transporter MFP subunit